MISNWQASKYGADTLEAASRSSVAVKEVWPEIQNEPGLGANERHADIPY